MRLQLISISLGSRRLSLMTDCPPDLTAEIQTSRGMVMSLLRRLDLGCGLLRLVIHLTNRQVCSWAESVPMM